jgi:DNA adenine methylase
MVASKPLLKWVGGKTQILDKVLDTFPCEICNYYEPFIGGGSVLIGLLRKRKSDVINISGKIYASDINPRLVWFYKNVQQCPVVVWNFISKIKEDYESCTGDHVNRNPQSFAEARTSSESMFYWQRKRFNSMPVEAPEAAALLLFLNKTCFRGIYREGPNGFNVPYGHYKKPSIVDERQLMEMSDLIKYVEFRCCSFDECLTNVEKGDFVYLDPPYVPETATSFVGYTKDGFKLENHKTLFEICKSLSNKKVILVMSNADVQLVRDSFVEDVYDITTLSCKRTINSKKPQSTTNEVLVVSSHLEKL